MSFWTANGFRGRRRRRGIIIDDIGIPESLASEFLEIVVRNGELIGIVTEAGNSHYVSLADLTVQAPPASKTPSNEVNKGCRPLNGAASN